MARQQTGIERRMRISKAFPFRQESLNNLHFQAESAQMNRISKNSFTKTYIPRKKRENSPDQSIGNQPLSCLHNPKRRTREISDSEIKKIRGGRGSRELQAHIRKTWKRTRWQ